MKKYYKKKNYIRYSNCHEDAEILLSLVRNTDKTALSIASAGDNTFSLLVHDFRVVYAFDYNPAQIALMKLKAVGIKYLSREEFLVFIGITKGKPLFYYQKISKYLDEETRKYFDDNIFLIGKIKLIHCGRFESYFRLFNRYFLKLTHSKRVIKRFMNCTTVNEQWNYYLKKFNNRRFQVLFKWFFSKKIMSKYGRDKSFFSFAEGEPTNHLKSRLEIGFQNVLNKENPYMQYVMFAKFITLPHYLQAENYELIKKNIDRLVFIQGDIYTIYKLDIKFDFFNLSDIFEYMSEVEMKNNEEMISSMCCSQARIVFWNMMVSRSFSNSMFRSINADNIFRKDKAFYYSALRIYEVKDYDH